MQPTIKTTSVVAVRALLAFERWPRERVDRMAECGQKGLLKQ